MQSKSRILKENLAKTKVNWKETKNLPTSGNWMGLITRKRADWNFICRTQCKEWVYKKGR